VIRGGGGGGSGGDGGNVVGASIRKQFFVLGGIGEVTHFPTTHVTLEVSRRTFTWGK